MHTHRVLGALLLGGLATAALSSSSNAQPAGAPAAAPVVETVKLARSSAYRVKGESTFFFKGEFMIDADGAPKAYHPGYTCDPAHPKGWRRTANVDCAARSPSACSERGFKGDPAPGTEGDFVRCDTTKVDKKWICAEVSHKRVVQGGCKMDASANSGLDNLANAGEPGNFYGIVTDKTGTPVVQGPSDPAPGYYVSSTALVNPGQPDASPLRYVDSSKVNYVALPPSAMKSLGAKKGDYVLAVNWKTGTMAGAIFADVGSDGDDDLGEGSIALAAALGVAGTPKGGGGKEHIVYVVFAGSSAGFPKDASLVPAMAMVEFAKWGGPMKLMSVVPREWAAQYKKS